MRLIISLLTIILGLDHIASSYSLSRASNTSVTSFSAMTFNANCFNPINRNGQKDKFIFQHITDSLINIGPDILCLQEYCSYPTIRSFDTQSKFLNTVYNHLYYQNRWQQNDFSTAGLATFSIFPIISKGTVISQKEEVIGIYTDLLISNDTIRVYNTHLHSMGLINTQDSAASSSVSQLVEKLKLGFILKTKEANALYHHIDSSPFKVIIAGDFNETPYSYIYKKFDRTFNNSFEIAGNGFGFTYNGRIPGLRIDHQFSDKRIGILNHRVLSNFSWTDHYPVIAYYVLE